MNSDSVELAKASSLRGDLIPPPDKSISHRALLIASIARGDSIIRNLLRADDPMRTLNAMRLLGVEIKDSGDIIRVSGRGLYGLIEPEDVIDCGNSGTTMRLLAGLLSGQNFFSVLNGDSSLRQRPMRRVITPLKMMGADLRGRARDTLPPLTVSGGKLKGIYYQSPVPSAQVKSAILLAGLYAEGETVVTEPQKSRDHTERMLPALGARLSVDGLKVTVTGGYEISPFDIAVPGDFSSAAFFIAGAVIVGGSEVLIRNVGINLTRTGLLDVVRRMGADVELINPAEASGEPVSDILCRYTEGLKATEIGHEEVPSLIDEIPVIAVIATQARGKTVIRGAEELRLKESDRIAAISTGLREMGAYVEEFPDGLSIEGPVSLRGAVVESHKDHRVAMALSIAALVAEGKTTINGISSVEISFPGFYDYLNKLCLT